MEDVCANLDGAVLQIFQVLEDLYAGQDKLEQVMKEGFFGMSRARYLLGVKRVSADQILDADLTAKFRTVIDSSVVPDGCTFSELDNSVKASEADKLTLFELCDAVADVYIDKREDVTEALNDVDTDRQKGLRKRHTDSEESKSSKIIEKSENTEKQPFINKTVTKHVEVNDVPTTRKDGASKTLSLFGVLTPQPLRSSQKCFEEAVKIAVSLADLKLKLSLLQREYQQLCRRKESLVLDEQ